MDNVFIGRQAIYDKKLNVYAYELLSRSNAEQNHAFVNDDNASQATTEVILNALTEIGLPQLVGKHPAFINLTQDFLSGQTPIPDLQHQIIIEVLENITITPQLVESVKKLSASGYLIALDDFVYRPEIQPLLEIADIVKIDIREHSEHQLRQLLKQLKPYKIKLLAEKLETHAEYDFCCDLGFDYYQGYFLCEPNIVSTQRAPANRANIIHLLAQLQDPQVQIETLEALISQDLALSYRLLKYINSAAFALQREVDSIHHAIVMLGLNTIRSLANLMLLSNINDKPRDLLMIASTRARFCEQLGMHVDKHLRDTFFTAGLFSVIDALMDRNMHDIISELPLSTVLKEALLLQKGVLGEAVKCVIAFERAEWDKVSFSNLDKKTIQQIYFDAIIWSNQALSMLAH